jgi:hypothetical protein
LNAIKHAKVKSGLTKLKSSPCSRSVGHCGLPVFLFSFLCRRAGTILQ